MTTRNDVVLGRAGLLVLALLVSVVARVGNSAEVPVAAGNSTSPTQRLQFETDVVPILRAYCWKCHGGEGRVGGLDTRTLPLLLAGGKSGAAIVRGAAEKSLLFQKFASRQMPPGNELKPTDAHVATIRAWLDARAVAAYEGGPLTPDEAPPIEALDREWWAFRKPVRPQVPTTVSPLEKRGNGGCHRWRTPIDVFVIRQLEEKGLSFAADADPLTLVRRVSLDLIGLPPSPREVDAFLNDQAPDAYENLVERLLASPHYGERWGRHWLDAAGYVDTIGSDNDTAIIEERERIWKYRDYVIRSFNHDKPFDRFLVEQLAAASVLDLAYETAATQKLYGLENPATKAYGLRCLLARKLIETGVRFVQIHPKPFQPWDTHANTQSSLVDICGNTDLPTAGLIRDLKQRGLLDQTIVIWSGEFGRLPVSQNGTGRDHNRNAFSLLAAGGGFKPGFVFGETDEVGYRVAENRVSVADFHATVLYQLGLDHESLTFHHSGRDETLTDASLTDARVVHELLT